MLIRGVAESQDSWNLVKKIDRSFYKIWYQISVEVPVGIYLLKVNNRNIEKGVKHVQS